MRRWVTLAVLAALLAALGLLVRHRMGRLGGKPSAIKGAYPTEERWLVGEITRDIAEMALYAAGREAGSLRFTIDGLARSGEPMARISLAWDGGPPLSHELTIRRFVWSPEDYGDYALAVLAGLELRTSTGSSADDESLLKALLNPQARVIETQNQRVAELLSRTMLDPVAHEQAALVIGTLALREAAGIFADSRQLLNRMTAHLALARALRGLEPLGLSGRYADVILLTDAGRCRGAMDALARLRETPGGSEVQRRWITTLTMRNTRDWRILRLPEQASLLERLEYFRALAECLNTAAAAQFYEHHEADPVSDWGRIAMAHDVGPSAGGGFAQEAVERELDEASDVWERIHSKQPSGDELMAALNQLPERCLTAGGPRPLAWGTWAAFFQRHLCNQVLETDSYVRDAQSLKDAAEAELAKADTEFRQLALYSVARCVRAGRAEKTIESVRDALDAAIGTMVGTPELVNLDGWIFVRFGSRYAPLWKGAPDENDWFATDSRFATTYESIGSRQTLKGARQDLPALEALRAINPFNNHLKHRILAARYGKDPSLERMQEEFGEISRFNLGVLYDMAWAAVDDPPQRREVLARVCALWNDGCIDLGDQLVQDGLDDEAAKAYERAVEKAIDRVSVSNSCQWLMHYYYDKRDFDRARTIATMAAEVYSRDGLSTMGEFLEREGQLDEAEEYYERIRERYDDDSELLGFYYRRARIHDDASYEAKLGGLLGKVFPSGLHKLDPAQLSGTPKDGVEIRDTSPKARRCGLDRGNIIVGVDGWRVRTFEQYQAVLEVAFRPEVTLHAWHSGRYLEVAARLPNRRLDADLVTLGSRP